MIRFIQSLNILPRWIILLIDLIVLAISFVLAYLIRFDFNIVQFSLYKLWSGLPVFLVCNLVAIFITQSYAGIIRHTGLQDGYRVVYTTTIGIILTLFINYAHLNYQGAVLIPLGVLIMAYLNSLIYLIGYRILVKYIFSYYRHAVRRKTNILIFGAGKSGLVTKSIIDADYTAKVKPVAFVEDDLRKIGKVINGLRIYNAKNNLEELIRNYNITEMIITVPNLSLERKNEIVDICLKHKIKVRSIPPAEKWINGELSFNQIHKINIEDLLGRESIKLDNSNVLSEIANKKIMITGAAGSIGSELVRQIVSYNPKSILMVDQAESGMFEINNEVQQYQNRAKIEVVPFISDICNKNRMEYLFSEFTPDIVFHAAAYKHVPLLEEHPTEACLCNIKGTKNLADLSARFEVEKFIMISTDKAVNPTSVMGATKRIAEMYVQSLNNRMRLLGNKTSFVTTRFGNVLGSNGSVIPLFKKQIQLRQDITVTHPDVVRYFMTIPEACQLVLEAAALAKGGEIYLFDMGRSVKIVDIAKKMVKLSGLELGKDINIKFIGLRAGEKLFEELLRKEENTLATHHPKILIAQERSDDYENVNQQVIGLIDLATNYKDSALVHSMKAMIPEYKSNTFQFGSTRNPQTYDKAVS